VSAHARCFSTSLKTCFGDIAKPSAYSACLTGCAACPSKPASSPTGPKIPSDITPSTPGRRCRRPNLPHRSRPKTRLLAPWIVARGQPGRVRQWYRFGLLCTLCPRSVVLAGCGFRPVIGRGHGRARPRDHQSGRLCATVVGVIIAWFAWQDPKAPASPRPVSASAGTATPIPTVGEIRYTQLQVGDCLTGSNLHLNAAGALPVLIRAVPCSQGHIGEVFFADQAYWNKHRSFPGESIVSEEATTKCDTAFKSYVGAGANSIYEWSNDQPSAEGWRGGFRTLYCIVYSPTFKQPGGSVIHGSLKGADK